MLVGHLDNIAARVKTRLLKGRKEELCNALGDPQTPSAIHHGRLGVSPLGKALIGRRAGDEIEVTVPSGDKFYAVKKIEFV